LFLYLLSSRLVDLYTVLTPASMLAVSLRALCWLKSFLRSAGSGVYERFSSQSALSIDSESL